MLLRLGQSRLQRIDLRLHARLTCAAKSAHRAHPFSRSFSAMMADNITHALRIHQDQFKFRERLQSG